MRDLPKYPAVGSRLRGNDGWGVRGLGCGELGWSVGRGFPPAREGRRGPAVAVASLIEHNDGSWQRIVVGPSFGAGTDGGCLDVGYVAA